MTAPDQPPASPAATGSNRQDDLRDRIAASVRHHIDHEIIAEWICCDPVNPSHHLCWWGEGVRQTMRSLLADNDDEYQSKAIDGITADLQPVLDAKDADIKRLHVEVSRFRRAWEDAMADGDQQAVQRLSLRNQLNQERQRAEAAEAERRDWQMAAQTAENELARLREQHQQIRDLP